MTFARGRPGRRVAAVGLGATLLTGLLSPAATASTPTAGLDRAGLRTALQAVHDAGMPGTYSVVRDGRRSWHGAAGVADTTTKRPVRPNMEHRAGSVTKTFTAAAVLQQVQRGRVELDAPIGRYLPKLMPGKRGTTVTVRMLLNHTSGIGDYAVPAFPSLAKGSTADLDRYRFRDITPRKLVRLGLQAKATGKPGATWSYSNTNYILAGLLLRKVTGTSAQHYITHQVIRRAGLRHTYFPTTARIRGPHSKGYESYHGLIDPPRDYSVYNMSWARTAGGLVSTMGDLDRFYRALLDGRIVNKESLAQMRRTIPVKNAQGKVTMRYGLGIYARDLPCGRFWGHDGVVFGYGTQVLSSPDGRRQVAIGMNETKYQRIDKNGKPKQSPIDKALNTYLTKAICGTGSSNGKAASPPTHAG